MPSCLGELHALRALHLYCTPAHFSDLMLGSEDDPTTGEAWQALNAALGRLHLDTLILHSLEDYCSSVPPAVGQMAGLRRFFYGHCTPPDTRLPAGPWLASVRQLGVPVECLADSTELLPQMRQLEDLEVTMDLCEWKPEIGVLAHCAAAVCRSAPALRDVARHPSLRRLCPHIRGPAVPFRVSQALVEAQAANPSLLIDFGAGMTGELVHPWSCGRE